MSRGPRVLITGAAGQVGKELATGPWRGDHEILALTRAELDITDEASVGAAVGAFAPSVIVNAAAYTAVDRAEDEPDLAHAVNASAVAHLAGAAEAVGARLIHISTDYVFDGSKETWYVETDPLAPLGVYGASKAAGEAAAASIERHLTLRTAWVYAGHGANFVATMLRLAGEHESLRVVADQRGCPTSAADIAAAIITITADTGTAGELSGLFHMASPREATWFEFASAILADRVERGEITIEPIPTSDYPTPAARPANSRLDSSALAAATGIELPAWDKSLPAAIAALSRP